MAEVTEINDLEQLQAYRLLWKSLQPQTPKASFFHTFDWLETFWKHYGDRRKMRVLIVRAAGRPVGIVPLCVQRERFRIGTARVLTYPLGDWGLWYGPLGPNQSASLFMAARHLHDTPRDWDLLDLRWTPRQGTVCQSTARALRCAGWSAQQNPYQQTSNIDLTDDDWQSYFASRSKKWRHESRRQVRTLLQTGQVTFERHRPLSSADGDGDPNWDFFETCQTIARNSWQAASKNGNTICHPQVEPFLRDCHARAARLGMLDMTLLKLDGKPIAYQYNYVQDGTVTGLRMGYDQKYAALSPGNVLLNYSLEDSFCRQDRLIELGTGESRFKRRLRTHVETNYRLTYYPWSAWKAQGVRLTRMFQSSTVATASKQTAVP